MGERTEHADHEELRRDRSGAERMVHRRRLHRRYRRAVGPLPPEHEQRPLHAGGRTAWHTHPNGQTIYVLEGVGRAQRRGGQIEVIRPGDRVFFEAGEEHWHGAAPDRFMTHLAMVDVDDEGNAATWGEQVTDEEYAVAPGS
jgi:quercetin dioxygenase-like cupin family protein